MSQTGLQHFQLQSDIFNIQATLKTPANKNIENNGLYFQLVSRYFLNPSWSNIPSLDSKMLTSAEVFPGDIQFK